MANLEVEDMEAALQYGTYIGKIQWR